MATTDQNLGEILTAIQRVRQLTDEPSDRAKYTDSHILQLMSESWNEVLQDVFGSAQNIPLARHSLSLVAGTRYYDLPCTVGELLRFDVKDGNIKVAEIYPGNLQNPWGVGIHVEGTRRILLDPKPIQSMTVEVLYIPSGDILMHVGEALTSTGSTSGLKLRIPLHPILGNTAGSIDRRPNAYVGSFFTGYLTNGSLPSGYFQFPIQQRIITSYDVADASITVEPNFDFDISKLEDPGQIMMYEVVPFEATAMWPCIVRHTARHIAAVENRMDRFKMCNQLYAEAKRSVQLRSSNALTKSGMSMDPRVSSNPDFHTFWYTGIE
jgi:hypothetical protein